jgi:hypothetical protein
VAAVRPFSSYGSGMQKLLPAAEDVLLEVLEGLERTDDHLPELRVGVAGRTGARYWLYGRWKRTFEQRRPFALTAGSQRISRRDRVAVALAGEEMLVFVAAPPRVPSIAHRHDFVRRVGDVDVRCSLTVSNVGPPLLDPGHALGA